MQKINSTPYIISSLAFLSLAFFLLFFPSFALALGVPDKLVPCTNNCQVCDLYKLARNIIDLLLWGIATPLLIVAILAAGFFWLTSGGSEEKISKGRTILVSAVTGFVIAFGAWVIINTILSTLAFKNPFDSSAWSDTNFCSQSPIK